MKPDAPISSLRTKMLAAACGVLLCGVAHAQMPASAYSAHLTAEGKLGIGIDDPVANVHVIGDIFFTGCVKNISTGAIVSGTCVNGTSGPVTPSPGGIPLPPDSGRITIDVNGTGAPIPSDVRLKKDIQPLPATLTKFSRLQVRSYTYRREQFPERGFPAGVQIGVIAQDLRKLFPELVIEGKDGYLSVDYDRLDKYMLQTVSELAQADIAKTQEIAAIKSGLETMQAALASQKREIAALKAQQQTALAH